MQKMWMVPLLGVLLGIAGCGGGGGGGGGGGPRGSMTAKVDGRSFSATLAHFTPSDGRVVIMGFTNDGRAIEIDVDTPTSLPATYDIESGDADGMVMIATNPHDPNTYVDYFALEDSGTVTITALTANNCQGTFSFRAEDDDTGKVISVTDGKFNVPKSQES